MANLQHFILGGGSDAALVVNGVTVLTADEQFEPTGTVEDAAEKLALALQVGLERIELTVPDDEWTWDEIIQDFNAKRGRHG